MMTRSQPRRPAEVLRRDGRDGGDEVVALRREVARLTQALEAADARAAALDEAVRARDTFLAVAAHELRNPMGALAARVQLALRAAQAVAADAGTAGGVVARLEAIERQTHRFIARATTLLDVARMTSGRSEIELGPVDLAALVREVVEQYDAEAAHAGCELHAALPDALPVRCDRVGVEQVVSNLVSNAVRYGAGCPIDVTLAHDGVRARIAVRDRGGGIALEDQARIFERFERAVAYRQHGGFGLGLWIARRIVESHGGTLGVVSAPGKGAEFAVTLPLAPQPEVVARGG